MTPTFVPSFDADPMNFAKGAEEEPLVRLRERYREFAEHEAKGLSSLYAELARAVAESDELLRFIAGLPGSKQQPNLVFAAVRHLYGTPGDPRQLSELVERHADTIRHVILQRRTQTNEPARCATLLPVLARLPEPLALIEVGASAGLCLLPDRYAYDYGRGRLEPVSTGGPHPPTFRCEANEGTPIPDRIPRVVWRAGLDLNPLDVSDPEQAAWLETLVWPGREARAERLRAAIRVAHQFPALVTRGDLLNDVPALVDRAPKDATLVIFHSAVLPYVAGEDRERFSRMVADLGAIWISNESPAALPWVAAKLESAPPENRFLLSVNGEPVALTGPHGQSVDWLR